MAADPPRPAGGFKNPSAGLAKPQPQQPRRRPAPSANSTAHGQAREKGRNARGDDQYEVIKPGKTDVQTTSIQPPPPKEAGTSINQTLGTVAAGVGQALLGISEAIWRTPEAIRRWLQYLEDLREKIGLPAALSQERRWLIDKLGQFAHGVDVWDFHCEGTSDVADRIQHAQTMLSEQVEPFKRLADKAHEADEALAKAIHEQDFTLGIFARSPKRGISGTAHCRPRSRPLPGSGTRSTLRPGTPA